MLMALLGPRRLIPLPYNARLATNGVLSWKAVPVHLG